MISRMPFDVMKSSGSCHLLLDDLYACQSNFNREMSDDKLGD